MTTIEHYTTIVLVVIYIIIALDAFFTCLRNRKERKIEWELHEIERKAANFYLERWFKKETGIDLGSEPKFYESMTGLLKKQ